MRRTSLISSPSGDAQVALKKWLSSKAETLPYQPERERRSIAAQPIMSAAEIHGVLDSIAAMSVARRARPADAQLTIRQNPPNPVANSPLAQAFPYPFQRASAVGSSMRVGPARIQQAKAKRHLSDWTARGGLLGRLSKRESEVCSLIAAGIRPAVIAAELGISTKTVSTFRQRILEKMGMHSNAEIAAYVAKSASIGDAP